MAKKLIEWITKIRFNCCCKSKCSLEDAIDNIEDAIEIVEDIIEGVEDAIEAVEDAT